MKAKRRHELQTNALADWLGSRVELVKPYWKTFAAVAVVLFLLGFVSLLRTGSLTGLYIPSWWGGSDKDSGWLELYTTLTHEADEAQRRDTLERLAQEHAAAPVGKWARLWLADHDVESGLRSYYLDREKSLAALRKARDGYEQVVQQSDKEPMLIHRALFGLGRAHEALGDLEKARKTYEELAALAGDSAFGKAAQNRLDYLVDADTGKLRPELIALVDEIQRHDWAPLLPDRTTPDFGSGFENPGLDDSGLNLEDLLQDRPDRPKAPGSTDADSPIEPLIPDRPLEDSPDTDKSPADSGDTPPADATPSTTFQGDSRDNSQPQSEGDADQSPADSGSQSSDKAPDADPSPEP